MKWIIFLFALFLTGTVTAQESEKLALFRELSVSGNCSLPVSSKNPAEVRPGFGIAVYTPFRPASKINPVIGLEFVQTRFFSSGVVDGDDVYYTNADFYYNQLRLPLSLRFHFGQKTTFFIEPGIFFSIPLSDYLEGVLHKPVNGVEVTELAKVNLRSSAGIGLSLGLGIHTPLRKGALLFRLDENAGSGRTYLASGSPNESTIFYNHYLRFSVIYRLPAKQ